MKAHQLKITNGILTLVALVAFSVSVFAQDDDGIYGDIYETPSVEEEIVDTISPLDGYSTVDDYYPEGGYNQNNAATEPYSEQYIDENGNNVTNNYYGDYYEEDNDFSYSSRIRRFHRNNSWGYYDPWYTNMYYYNYDPFFWGTSIYVGYRPSYSWGWNSGWGWNTGWGWNNSFGWNNGWNQPYGYPACYGGYGWGWGNGGYWNGYNNGYWNGFNDGLAYGGYYNTFDSNSGIYYGHRGSGNGTVSSIGSGYRSKNFASAYNDAALNGKVSHANRGNILKTNDGRSVNVANLDGFVDRRFTDKESAKPGLSDRTVNERITSVKPNSQATERNRAVQGSSNTSRTADSRSTVERNPYQRPTTQRPVTKPTRLNPNNVDRSRDRSAARPRTNSQSASRNAYQRGNSRGATSGRQQATHPNSNNNRGNISRDIQRSTPNSNGYNRGNSNGNDYTRPTRPNTNSRNGYRPPSRSNTQPSRTPSQPSRNATRPSRPSTPSRSTQPSRSSEPSRSVSPNRGGSSSRGSYSTPSRSSGSSSGRSSGSRSSGSTSRSGRP